MPIPHAPFAPRFGSAQRGVTLIEALVALLVMSFGMLALVGLMSNLRFGADLAKQRSEAMRIARAEIANLRSYSELSRTASTPAAAKVYSEITNQTQATQVTPADSNTTYALQRLVTPLATGGDGVTVRVNVAWNDRTGAAQFINLDTVIASVDPVFTAAVGFTPQAGSAATPPARNALIPNGAKRLDKNNSAFRPSNLGSVVWVFNNLSGVIVGKCSIAASTPVSALTSADVASCNNNTIGFLLSGTVNFSNSNPVNPSAPEATAIPLDLDIDAGSYLLPRLDANGNPLRATNGSILTDTYTATRPTFECYNDSPGSAPSSQPFVNYYCVVYPTGTPATWAGKVVLTGFSLGTTAAEYRVCRYSADYDGSGDGYTPDKKSIDNYEHPAVYGKVLGSLSRQNFLVVRGNRTCPTAPAVDPANGVFADYSTLQIQP